MLKYMKKLLLLLLPFTLLAQGPPPSCVPTTIVINLDQYQSETYWVVEDTSGNMLTYGSNYSSYPDYAIVVEQRCLPAGPLTFTIYDSYGDGLNGSLWGGLDGSYYLIQCNDTLVYGDDPAFGNDSIHVFVSDACPPVFGCMDPLYVEFNPLADTNDSSCTVLKVFGCIDSSMYNWDPYANTMSLIPNCDYVLTLYDLVGDGWTDSELEIKQDTNIWYFSLDTALFQNDYIINLKSPQPVTFKFTVTSQAALTASHCGFKLTNPDGVVMKEVLPPFINPGFTHVSQTYCGNLCIEKIFGCTYPTAINYDSLANTDDVSCYYDPGCTNPVYLEYNANYDYDDGSCSTLVVLGCMDSLAFNYNPLANTELTGSCISIVTGCMQPLAFNYNPNANTSDTCIAIAYGCMSPVAINYDSLANTDDGSCVGVTYGCTDSTMWNYSPSANVDDDGCIPYIYGCMDVTQWNYNPLANTDNNACIAFAYGCMDSTMFNYDPLANTSNDNCTPYIYGCINPIALNYNAAANTDDFSCILPIYGCMDSLAFNYNPLANIDNNSCLPVILGCTDPIALNYNASANTDDFSCVLPIYGCTDSTMFNYNPLANVDNSSCVAFLYGCTDPSMLNYNAMANTEDFTCISFVYGCMDPTALNYDSLANTDNESCITIVEGCMDQSAYNYNISANFSDSVSCLFAASCVTGAGVPYWLNDPCYAWVIDVDNYCCENEWDTICQATYDYCDGSWSGPLLKRSENKKELIMITDLLGRKTKKIKNQLLFYIYNDGSVERKLIKQ